MTASALLAFHFLLLLPAFGLFPLAIGLAYTRMPDFTFFKRILLALFLFVFLVTWFGLFVYVPYRAPGNAKADLLAAQPSYHTILFEHKEYSAYAIWLLLAIVIVAAATVTVEEFQTSGALRLLVRGSLIIALALTLLVSVEGLLVTRMAAVH